MLEVEGETEEVLYTSSWPSNEFLDPIFEKEDLVEGFKVIWFVVNNFFLRFEIRVGPTHFHKILLGRLGTRLCVHSISWFY